MKLLQVKSFYTSYITQVTLSYHVQQTFFVSPILWSISFIGDAHFFLIFFYTGNTPFGGIPLIFGAIIQNYLFKVKFGTQTNSNMQNFMRMLTFSFLDQKNPFRASLDQKFKIFLFKVNFGILTNMPYLMVMPTLSVLD